MARRKGGNRGKSTINARKTALENAREKLRDDPGGTKESQQQKAKGSEVNISNMEATTTVNTPTKYYNKTKLQNNSHQQHKTSSTTSKKSIHQTTYRETKETNETSTQMVETTSTITQKKLTAKQSKAAAKLAAQQQNAKNDTTDQQEEQIHNEASKKIMREKVTILNVTNIPATATKSNTTAINTNNANITHQRNLASTTAPAKNIRFDRNSNNNNNNNNSSNMNTSDNSMNSSISDQQQQLKLQQQPENSGKSDNEQQQQQPQLSDNATTSMAWNNSKYLHKKFKRLASTTENDVLQESEKLRTTSVSSASSSVSPPPPLTVNQQYHQPKQQPKKSILTTPSEKHITNGGFKTHDNHQTLLDEHSTTNNNINNFNQNMLLNLSQPQHGIPSNSLELSHINSNSTSLGAPTDVNCGFVTTLTSSSSTVGGGGRYKCPHCDLSCTKPSVLQKHIRAHTNERPFPCEICGIAFKTKSNLYKHCRSRSHAARQNGSEVSPDADDGLSDQDVDLELSNSSSEMFSRTESPIDGLDNITVPQTQTQTQFQQHCPIQNEKQISSASSKIVSISATPAPLSLSILASKSNYMPQTGPASQKLALGSTPAGTQPTTATSSPKQSAIEYKPYKPKFHNASLYATAKEAVAASTSSVSLSDSMTLAESSPAAPPKDTTIIQKLPESLYTSMNHYQHTAISSEQKTMVPSGIHLPPPPNQPSNQLPHHPSLTPSTQIKLNNLVSSHQLQQMQQHQLQHIQTQTPHHLLGLPPSANALSLPMSAATYLGQPPAAPASTLLHPSAHLRSPYYYNHVYSTLNLMIPQQQQQFHNQLQLQQQHLQQRQMLVTHSTKSAAIPAPPPQSPHSQSPPSIPQSSIKSVNQLPNTNNISISSNNARNVHHTKVSTASANSAPALPTPQNSLYYLSTAASPVPVALNPPNQNQTNSNKINVELMEQSASVIGQRTPPNMCSTSNQNTLLQTSVNSGIQEVTLNKEKLNEHINKLISQNEAIVENKELLLQKKYPKTLNRSRSFTNNSTSANGSTNSVGNNQSLQTPTGGPPSESATNAKLAQAIVQKQQLQQQQHQQQQLQQHYVYQQQQQHQQQQQQMHKQRHLYHDKLNLEEVPPTLPLNGTSKHLVSKHMVPSQQVHSTGAVPVSNQAQYQQYRTIVTITPTLPRQQPHSSTTATHPSLANVPLNLSAKTKMVDEGPELDKQPQAPPPAPPRKRNSIEQPQTGQNQLLTPALTINEASNSSNSNSSTPQPCTSTGKYPSNNSIIKNLLLNARGLAVPTGTGDDAVYICPLCSLECRTAEELKLHNSTYCQGSNSSANSPASSPSHKYFRSNSLSLNMADFKILSKNPLSLVKLAWSQLKTKPSNLVLNRLNPTVASASRNTSTNITPATSIPQTSQSSVISTSSASPSSISQQKPLLPVNEIPMRFVDAPLPSPGPLLGKTPLVDYTVNESKSKSEEVIITKMHDDPIYSHGNMTENSAGKRSKFDPLEKFTTKGSTATSGGDIQLLSVQELTKKDERYKRFTSSGGCMIPLSECDDIDKSTKMIRTPLLSGGSFQEVSPKKETKIPLPLMPGTQLTSNISLGLSSSNGPQHFQFPPINQITAFNPLTLALSEKEIRYVPGMPGPNSLQPQLPLAPISGKQQSQQQHLLNIPQGTPIKQLSRTASPNRTQTTSPMNMSTSLQAVSADISGVNRPTFGGVQNVPSEFNRAPPSTSMRNIRNWQPGVSTFPNNVSNINSSNIKTTSVINDQAKSPKSFNFMRIADNLSPRKNSTSNEPNALITTSQTETETRYFNLDKVSREQIIIQQPFNNSQSLSPTNLALTPLHVDINVAINDTDSSNAEVKAKSKFLRPTSLPLRPGSFTLKRHHGITPTANTLPLISPETPRPSKECVQLYLNGNSYTYLGLKCSTKPFYCTLNCPQPSYVQDMHKLSMYSMWQQCVENNPHPLGLKPKDVMSLYDSRQKTLIFTMATGKKTSYTVVAAQQIVMTPFISSRDKFYHHQLKPIPLKDNTAAKDNKISALNKFENARDLTGAVSATNSIASSQTLEGGYESHENYIYVRGRGRGKYVCSECGIRCKKPSMLKKHIRTHTDVRPYTCKHCNFSFKTKGNLTKHMQSKTHYKKCIELGLNPGPIPAEGDFLEPDVEFDQQSSTSAGGRTSSAGNGESDTDSDSSDNETESSNESDSPRPNIIQSLNVAAAEDNKSHLEHEAARCLLSLSMTPPTYTHSFETSMANSQIPATTVSSCTNVSVISTPAIKRVNSYTSPKPPFDYQKQEQYYSNPKEPKLKISNSSTSNYESAPIDLTKPRNIEVIPIPTLPLNVGSFSSNPGPVQTQAQIRDVIFGANKNESGFMKTMISVSSKVCRNYVDNYEENHHKLNEDMMLYDYRREQTLQYNKIKQTQLSRGLTVNPNVLMSNSPPTTSTPSSAIGSTGVTEVTTCVSELYVGSNTSNAGIQSSAESEIMTNIQLPKIAIVKPLQAQKAEPGVPSAVLASAKTSITVAAIAEGPKALTKTFKSSDEGEETDEEPPSKKVALKSAEKPVHNSNLPAAVLQPGTTDFSGVLSGGNSNSQTNNTNQPTRTVIVGEDGFTTNNNEILPMHPRVPQISNADGRAVCSVCTKTFQKQSQLALHMYIHYMERKYKCDSCGVSFRIQGHLQKHERSEAHKNKAIMTSTFGVPTSSNPRPFECTDCKIAFRIHGHLAKHLRSKTHVQKLECLQKLPFGTYAEIERAGISLTEIDTSDCENSLISLRELAQKLIEKDPSSKLGSYTTPSGDNSNTGLVSQDSASEDGFTAAERAAATAIASLDNNSAANTPRRANSTSEDESIAMALNNTLKRRLPGTFNDKESDKEFQEQHHEKRLRPEPLLINSNTHQDTTSTTN